MNLYLKTSRDEYELPEIVADSVQELAKKTGKTPGSIATMISRGYPGYCKVNVGPIWYADNDGGVWTYADNGRVIRRD